MSSEIDLQTAAPRGQLGKPTDVKRSHRSQFPRTRRRRYDYGMFLAFAAPNLLLLVLFVYWPVINNAYLSLTSWDLIAPEPIFIGVQNYIDLFTSATFLRVMSITVVFTVCVVVGSIVIGLLVASLLNQKLVGRNFVRTAVFAPYVLPGAAIGTTWIMIFDPNYGLSRLVFESLGATSPNWLTNSSWALPALIIVQLWCRIGFCAIVYIAAMQSLPTEQYEAASLDGAGAVRKFWSITVPLLGPTTFFLLIITTISTFQAFDIIAVMTGGGPAGATTTLAWFVYDEGFRTFNVGYAAAGSMVMFVILMGVTLVQQRVIGRKVHYQ